MKQQFRKMAVPTIVADKGDGFPQAIDGIHVIEIAPETSAMIAKHPGEDGVVFSDTRITMPVRYRASVGIPDVDNGVMSDAIANLLDASHPVFVLYSVTSLYTKCTNMAVVSSRNTDTVDMLGLRIQEIVFEECLEHDTQLSNKPYNPEDSSSQSTGVQMVIDTDNDGSYSANATSTEVA